MDFLEFARDLKQAQAKEKAVKYKNGRYKPIDHTRGSDEPVEKQLDGLEMSRMVRDARHTELAIPTNPN